MFSRHGSCASAVDRLILFFDSRFKVKAKLKQSEDLISVDFGI